MLRAIPRVSTRELRPAVSRAYYESSVREFLGTEPNQILGQLASRHGHSLETTQRRAWTEQIRHLQQVLNIEEGAHIFFEFMIPRMGKRADVVLLLNGVIFVLEYKVGESNVSASALDQALDYALDLKNFHAGSHDLPIVPVVVASTAPSGVCEPLWFDDEVAGPVGTGFSGLSQILSDYASDQREPIDVLDWSGSTYKPTPTIVEAARALYRGHSVSDISRSDSGAINLSRTTSTINRLIEEAKRDQQKIVCFVTGVPGAGKTLAGLNIATERMRAHEDEHAVFLSGNGPLVDVLREALARDEVAREKGRGEKLKKHVAKQRARTFIQNIHHFRDDALATEEPPVERVVVFDEAQRAWTREKASSFMRQKRDHPDFEMSEPEFLLSVLDRHEDWCVVICLIGGGQEINTGEAGLAEWFKALGNKFADWKIVYSDRIGGSEYSWSGDLESLIEPGSLVVKEPELHLGVSIRSFRSERVSAFVGAVIDGESSRAIEEFSGLVNYPIVMTRDLGCARKWLRRRSRGTERAGLVASSGGLRLKPAGIHVKAKINPPDWFLNDRLDVRSSYSLEDVATEFDIQGLELDWVGVCWDADFRYHSGQWSAHDFWGSRWRKIGDFHRKIYLANAYRVLLTRARQGMVIFIPKGDPRDRTRMPEFYDQTAEFLLQCGIPTLAKSD